MYLRGRPFQ